MPPAFLHPVTPNTPQAVQHTTPDFWHNLEKPAKSNDGGLDSCLELPATKRRRLNENHPSTACEAYTPQGQEQGWPQQTCLSSAPHNPQLESGYNQQSQASLTQQDSNLGRQFHEVLPSYNWSVNQHHQRQYAGSSSQYPFETPFCSENTIDVRGSDLASPHQGLQYERPFLMTDSQIFSRQHGLVAQNVYQNYYHTQDNVQMTHYSYNSWCETQYQTALQIVPETETEGAKEFDLDYSVLGIAAQCPPQSVQRRQSNIYSKFNVQKSQFSERVELQQDALQVTSQSREFQDAEGNGQHFASAVSEVCYGMLVDIECSHSVALSNTLDLPRGLFWDGKMTLHDSENDSCCIQLQERTFRMLNMLSDHAKVTFQFLILANTREEKKTLIASKKRIVSVQNPQYFNLSIILYGPADMAEAVGNWLHECHTYLQMPENCDRNVLYSNPHCLSFSDENKTMTSELVSTRIDIDTAQLCVSTDILAELGSNESFAEAPQPFSIATTLHKYQRQGLTFMLNREKGWDFRGSRTDVWQSYLDLHGTFRYKNTLSGQSQLEPPPEFKGGCLADCMGLGKTLSMLSLIAANPFSAEVLKSCGGSLFQESVNLVKATLIVVPFSLLQVWETQIQRHFQPSSVKLLIYYGQGREKHCQCFGTYDIVLTTYNSISLDWKSQKSQRQKRNATSLFAVHWHRIILDEAHMIRSEHTVCAKSIFSLKAEHRWCITGTPIQNRLSDLRSLLRFLRVHPYDDPKVFEAEISQPWKTMMDKTALEKLQLLIKIVALRRSRTVISLPERHEILHYVSFSPQENTVYERAKMGTIEIIDLALDPMPLSSKPAGSAYIKAFQKINDLRYICNHGVLPKRVKKSNHIQNDMQGPGSFHEELDRLLNASNSACLDCGIDIQEVAECSYQLLAAPRPIEPETPSKLCQECQDRRKACKCPSPKSSEASDMDDTISPSTVKLGLSSKVKALVLRLQQVPREDKCVVFSYWTSTLDLIEQALSHASITYCRYDGRLSRGSRSSVLETFTKDVSMQVILVSITCGGQGLDLTVANHAFLVEPQWNPMLEEQAMSRVHRLGQTKAVHLVRFIVKNTFEEKIVTSQECKKTLASMIMEGRRLESGNNGRKQLLHLRALVD